MTFWNELLGVAFEMTYVSAMGVRTRALRAGKGEPVVFLHGISGHLETFLPVIRSHAERYAVHAIDMLGHGFTDKISDPLTIGRLTQHVIDYLDAAGLERVHLVGLSLGGWTAAWLAAHHPDRIKTLTLIAAAGDPDAGPAGDPKMGEMLRNATRAGVLSTDKALTRKRLEMVVVRPDHVPDELVDARFTVYRQPAFIAALDSLVALTHRDEYLRWALTRAVLAKITSEVLVVWGDNDKGEGVSEGRYLVEGLARNKRVIFMNAGHWPPFERPAEYSAVALAFLAGGLAAVSAGTVT